MILKIIKGCLYCLIENIDKEYVNLIDKEYLDKQRERDIIINII